MIRTPRELGALIRDGRTTAGLDQKTLALRAGVSRLWISEVEQGKPGASIGRILRTLNVLGIELQPKFQYVGQEDERGRTLSVDLVEKVLGLNNGADDG